MTGVSGQYGDTYTGVQENTVVTEQWVTELVHKMNSQ